MLGALHLGHRQKPGDNDAGGSFQVVDLGVDISPEKFIKAIKWEKPQIMGMSVLLTTTMVNMKTTIDALSEAGGRDKVKVMMGGCAGDPALLRRDWCRRLRSRRSLGS